MSTASRKAAGGLRSWLPSSWFSSRDQLPAALPPDETAEGSGGAQEGNGQPERSASSTSDGTGYRKDPEMVSVLGHGCTSRGRVMLDYSLGGLARPGPGHRVSVLSGPYAGTPVQGSAVARSGCLGSYYPFQSAAEKHSGR
jgi:hypothetical protein